MKIIFNHKLDWFWQIYDEWSRTNEIIIPNNFKNDRESTLDLDALEKCVNENNNADFIFGFHGDLLDVIQWNKRNIGIPIIIFATNAINRLNGAKRSIYVNLWYVEQYAQSLLKKYNRENLFYDGMAANQYIFYPKITQKVYDISFFGQHYGERGYWLNTIKKYCLKNKYKYFFPKGDGSNLPWNYDQINNFYNTTKINLAFSPKSTLGRIVNLRTFEICMSGNFQLLQYTPCVEEYFEIDKEIVCWKNKKDLLEKITYYLTNEDEREKIAKNGYKKAISSHTWTKRLENIKLFLNRPKIDINKYVLKIDELTGKSNVKEIQKFKTFNPNQCYNEMVKPILKSHKYNIKSDLKKKTYINVNPTIKLHIDEKKIVTYSIASFNKIIMMVGVLPSDSEINLKNWNDFKKIIYLTENKDLSFPRFGILTNGSRWIIRDFINQKCLNHIPNRRELKSSLNSNMYFTMIILIHIADFLTPINIKFIKTIKRNIELLTWKIFYKKI